MAASSLLLPQDKFDTSKIQELYGADSDKVKPILGALLEWIQDINWPVAQELVHVLPRFHWLLTPHLRAAFASDDDIWKCSVLLMLKEFPRETVLRLAEEIKRIANSPTKGESLEEADKYAAEIIKKVGL